MSEADVDDIPNFGQSSLKPPVAVTPISDLAWPSLAKGESFFDRALRNGHLEADGDAPYMNGIGDAAASSALDDWAKDEETPDDIDAEEGGWDLDAGGAEAQTDAHEKVEETEETPDLDAGAAPGVKEAEFWVRNSPFPSDHVAAGSFETAMQVGLAYVFRTKDGSHMIFIHIATKSSTRHCQLCAIKTAVPRSLSVITGISISKCIITSVGTLHSS